MSSSRGKRTRHERSSSSPEHSSGKRVATRGSTSSTAHAVDVQPHPLAAEQSDHDGIFRHGLSPQDLDPKASPLKGLKLVRQDIQHSVPVSASEAVAATGSASTPAALPPSSAPAPSDHSVSSSANNPTGSLSTEEKHPRPPVTIIVDGKEVVGTDAIDFVDDLAKTVKAQKYEILKEQVKFKDNTVLARSMIVDLDVLRWERRKDEIYSLAGIVTNTVKMDEVKAYVPNIVSTPRHPEGEENKIISMLDDYIQNRHVMNSQRLTNVKRSLARSGASVEGLPSQAVDWKDHITPEALNDEFYHLCICAEGYLKAYETAIPRSFQKIEEKSKETKDVRSVVRAYERLFQALEEKLSIFKEKLGPSGELANDYAKIRLQMPMVSPDLKVLLGLTAKNFLPEDGTGQPASIYEKYYSPTS
jgi:hypothetical protein